MAGSLVDFTNILPQNVDFRLFKMLLRHGFTTECQILQVKPEIPRSSFGHLWAVCWRTSCRHAKDFHSYWFCQKCFAFQAFGHKLLLQRPVYFFNE